MHVLSVVALDSSPVECALIEAGLGRSKTRRGGSMKIIEGRRGRGAGWLAITAALALVSVGAPAAHATDVPAYGTITITNNGTGGLQTPNTYEDPNENLWD